MKLLAKPDPRGRPRKYRFDRLKEVGDEMLIPCAVTRQNQSIKSAACAYGRTYNVRFATKLMFVDEHGATDYGQTRMNMDRANAVRVRRIA